MDADSLLLLAAERDDLTGAGQILSAGGNINCRDYKENTPLHIAAARSNWRMCRFLLDFSHCYKNPRNDTEDTPLSLSVLNKHPETVMTLLEYKCDVNTKNIDGVSPLHIACQVRDEQSVRMLLSHGADPSTVDNDGNSPLHMVCTDPISVELAEMLLIAHASVNASNIEGFTPLELAVQESGHNVKILVDLLLSKGAIVTEDAISNATDHNIKSMLIEIACLEAGKHSELV
ncbi:hypothetical protein GEMRC1_002135 [Eukaryota sp. GEM-RC1]